MNMSMRSQNFADWDEMLLCDRLQITAANGKLSKILGSQKTIDRTSEKIKLFIDTFIEGMGGTV
jgi:hypothetical protein